MESLKIMLICSEYPPFPIAGSGMYAVNLVKGLKGDEVSIITPFDGMGERHERKGNLEIIRMDIPRAVSFIDRRVMLSLKLRRYLKGLNLKDYDLLHSLSLNEATFLDYSLVNKHIPVIISVNDYYALESTWNIFRFPYKSTDFPLRYLHHNTLRHFNSNALRRCGRIIANSRYVASAVRSASGVGEEKIDVIYRGIDEKRYDIRPGSKKYQSHEVLFVGFSMERKGAMYLIGAAPEILKRFPDARFTLIGTPSRLFSRVINRFIKRNNLEGRIRIINYLSPSEMPSYHAKANVFVMPSIMEGLGQVFMEAMMSRTPVIGTRVGGIPEIINGDVGILVEPGDSAAITRAITRIFSNPERARIMGENGRRRVMKMFTISGMVRKTRDIYRKVL